MRVWERWAGQRERRGEGDQHINRWFQHQVTRAGMGDPRGGSDGGGSGSSLRKEATGSQV